MFKFDKFRSCECGPDVAKRMSHQLEGMSTLHALLVSLQSRACGTLPAGFVSSDRDTEFSKVCVHCFVRDCRVACVSCVSCFHTLRARFLCFHADFDFDFNDDPSSRNRSNL